jgi:rifampicin phosphotransferase
MTEYQKMWESHLIPLLYVEWNLEAGSKNLKKHIGIGHKDQIIVVKNLACETFYSLESMKKEGLCGFKIFSSSQKAGKLISASKKLAKEGLEFSNQLCVMDLAKKTKAELLGLFEKSYNWSLELFGLYYSTQPQCSELVKQKLIKYFETKKVNDPVQAFLDITAPKTPSILKQAELDWHKIILSKKKENIKGYYDRYKFLGTEEGVEPKPLKYFTDKFDAEVKIQDDEILNNIGEINESLDAIAIIQSKLIKEYNIPKDIADLAFHVQEFGHARIEVRLAWVSIEWACKHLFDELGKRFNCNPADLFNYRKEEIEQLFKSGKKVPAETIRDRNAFFVGHMKGSKPVFLTGKDAEEFVQAKKIYRDVHEIEFKGNIANKGYAKGEATVIKADADIEKEMLKMKQGNILVVTQTKPMFMPVIKKAIAIVTDEGGITSHAAIVARELNIPCIIGTHYATKAFKDGDLLEVDANTGIVKKIS